MDFSNYKFRCSQLGKLMTNPKKKSDMLSKGTQTYLKELYVQEAHGRTKEIDSKYLEKGNYGEEDSLSLLVDVREKMYLKNQEQLENELISGTPDVIVAGERYHGIHSPATVIDIKTKWDMFTFMTEEGKSKDYFWQLQGYMWLTNSPKSELIFTLVDAPQHLIFKEFSKVAYLRDLDEGSKEMIELEKQITKNMTYDDIEKSKRLKIYKFDFEPKKIEALKSRIADCRDFLNNLTLN